MIRELINFMNDLMSDIPDIMEWKNQPDKGLHVFIDYFLLFYRCLFCLSF